MDWRDKLKAQIDAIEWSNLGESLVRIEVARPTALALIPYVHRVNETDLSGVIRGKILLMGVSEHRTVPLGSPQMIYMLHFMVRKEIPYNAVIDCITGATLLIETRDGEPAYPYVDFNSV